MCKKEKEGTGYENCTKIPKRNKWSFWKSFCSSKATRRDSKLDSQANGYGKNEHASFQSSHTIFQEIFQVFVQIVCRKIQWRYAMAKDRLHSWIRSQSNIYNGHQCKTLAPFLPSSTQKFHKKYFQPIFFPFSHFWWYFRIVLNYKRKGKKHKNLFPLTLAWI